MNTPAVVWKWKVSWHEETRTPSRPDGKGDRLVCTDDYGVWFREKAEAEKFAQKLRGQGREPEVCKNEVQ